MNLRHSNTEAFWSKELSEFYTLLKSSPEGLSEDVIGLSIKEGNKSTLFKEILQELRNYLKQFANPLMLLLIAAVILSAVLNEQSEMLIILTIVMVTGTAGYIQEFRAHRIVKNFRRSFPESVALSGVARKQK
ncbi:MAG: cation-transporting P-type ATPase [Saprospiraceae bacterium]